MAFQSEVAGSQIDGASDDQEDAFLITHLTDSNGEPSALIIVADGMGGHAAGNVASNMAVQAFSKSINTGYPTEAVSEILNKSLLKANASITDTVKETPALDGMGCTMVGVIIEGDKLWWVSVGDSHLYLLRDRKLTKLNADHSYGGFLDRMEAAGTPVEAEPGLSRNMLMSAVTGTDIAEIDCPPSPFTLEHDDKLIICSDGLDTLSEGKIIQYSDWADNSKECSEALLDAVEDAAMPRQDNTTAVVVRVIDDSAAEVVVEEEDDDDGDVTTPGAVGAGDTTDGDTTLEKEISSEPEKEPEKEPEDAPVETVDLTAEDAPTESKQEVVEASPEVPPETVAEDVSSESAAKSKTGLIIGIAATVFIAVAVGGYFMFGGSESAEGIDGEIASEEMVQEEIIIEEESPSLEVTEETGAEEIVETVTEPATETETVVDTETKPVEEATKESTPAPTSANKNIIPGQLKNWWQSNTDGYHSSWLI